MLAFSLAYTHSEKTHLQHKRFTRAIRNVIVVILDVVWRTVQHNRLRQTCDLAVDVFAFLSIR